MQLVTAAIREVRVFSIINDLDLRTACPLTLHSRVSAIYMP